MKVACGFYVHSNLSCACRERQIHVKNVCTHVQVPFTFVPNSSYSIENNEDSLYSIENNEDSLWTT